jgi:type II secretory pathway predicted ATPase ExeA
MYEAHFGLSGLPFEPLVQDRSAFGSQAYHRTVEGLVDAVRQRLGWTLVFGEPGCGKTTAVRALLARLEPDTAVAQLQAAPDAPLDVVGALFDLLGVPSSPHWGRAQKLARAEVALAVRAHEQKTTVLIVEDAHMLSIEALADLAAMGGFQDLSGAMLQIVLVGPHVLHNTLHAAAPPQRQSWSRMRSLYLEPYTAEETRRYVEHRLRQVGWVQSPSFLPAAWERIHHYSAGVPLRIDRLGHRLLMTAQLGAVPQISPELVDGTAAALHRETAAPPMWGGPVAPLPAADGPASPSGPPPIEGLIPANFRFVATAGSAVTKALTRRSPDPLPAPPRTPMQPAARPAAARPFRARAMLLGFTAGLAIAATIYAMHPAVALRVNWLPATGAGPAVDAAAAASAAADAGLPIGTLEPARTVDEAPRKKGRAPEDPLAPQRTAPAMLPHPSALATTAPSDAEDAVADADACSSAHPCAGPSTR